MQRVFPGCFPLLLLASLTHRAAAGDLTQQPVFVSGQDDYHTYRIPAAIVTPKGTLLAFCEGRKNGRADSGNIDLLLKRSLDGGRTWRPAQVVWDDGDNTCGNPCPVVDQATGTIWLLLTHNLGDDAEAHIVDGTSKGTRSVWVSQSTDDGATWSKPLEITRDVKRPDWTWYATGPGIGIQLRSGRLVVPCDNKVAVTKARQSHVIYSDDHGATWKLGGVVGPHCNESQVVELDDGGLMLNMRSYQANHRRLVATSKDGGLTWSPPREDAALIEPVCQASILRYPAAAGGKGRLLFSNPASTKREKMTVRASDDEGWMWTAGKRLHDGPAAYSCLTVLPDGTIGCLYECGEKHSYEAIAFARFPLSWFITSPTTSEASDDSHPLSLPLQTLQRDLASRDYHDVLATMIPTDLAAEWQRVATPDNYHVFAKQHGEIEKIEKDAALKRAYERRKQIATQFLELMRGAYERKKLKPPFEDVALLTRTLESVDRGGTQNKLPVIPMRAILPVAEADKHWPSFRGPTGQGLVFDTRIPRRWSATQNILWKAKLPGRGNSSPVIWGDRLMVTAEQRAADANAAAKSVPERLLLCFDRRDGRLLWRHAAPQPKEQEQLYWKNTFASSTPVTDGERVMVFFGNSGLLCSDLQGKRLWQQDLGTFPTVHGPGSSPVLYKDLVIVIQDQINAPSLCAAFDKRTGEKRWQRERGKSMCWTTPLLLRIGQRDELIYNGSHEVISYDPATGKELWKVAGTSQESIPMIVAGGGLLFSTSGRNGPTLAIRPGGNGDITSSHVVWRHERGGPHVPSPAYHDGRLYLISDTGVLTCLDAARGEALWQKRLRGRFSMSPLVIGNLLLLVNESGVSYLIKSSPRFEQLAENDLSETILATPAVLDSRIYFRTADHVICVGEGR